MLGLLLAAALAAPPVSDDLETVVSLMTKIGSCSQPHFSPDGRRVAFISNLSGVRQVWIAPSSGGWSTVSIVRWFEKYLKS